jgi:hypothetical protein
MRWKTLSAGLLLLSLPLFTAAAGRVAIEWYVNMKFAFSVAYPGEVFIPQGEAADGGGQKFLSRDGRAVVSAYGYAAPPNHTLAAAYGETLLSIGKEDPRRKVTYKSFKGDAFVIKGTDGERNFLKKVVYKPVEKQFVSFEAVYPASKGAYYDPLVSTMANSLKTLPGPAVPR